MSKEDNKRKIKIALTLEGRYIQKMQEIKENQKELTKTNDNEVKKLTEKSKKDTFFEDTEILEEQKVSKNIVRTFSASCL